jgi:hypothetical protein
MRHPQVAPVTSADEELASIRNTPESLAGRAVAEAAVAFDS